VVVAGIDISTLFNLSVNVSKVGAGEYTDASKSSS
jgi:hypothetical protein